MSVTGTYQEVAIVGGVTYDSGQKTFTYGSALSISESIPASTTDQLVTCSIDVSKVKMLYIKVDGALVIETNSGSAADDTLTFTSTKKTYAWNEFDIDTFLLGTDVTALYVTNASMSAAVQLDIVCIMDPTP